MPEPVKKKRRTSGKKSASPVRGKTGKGVTWCVDHLPVFDWICWNTSMRIILPVTGIVFLLVCALETISGGFPALEALLSGPFPLSLLILLGVLCAVVGLDLLLQGPDVLDCAADQKGIHIECCLPKPASWKLLARFRSPDAPAGEDGMVSISRTDIPWAAITRVQLWPGQTRVLLYCHSPWLTAALPCTPFTYPAVTRMITEKIGKKKNVRLPVSLRAKDTPAAKPKKPRNPSSASKPVMTPEFLADIQRMNAEDEARSRRDD
ncbi:MAG: hypothetical protein K6A68_00470 [Clostridiales bacterium]|nr:hypothetical protein [Clostridiales bacterium]